MYCVDFEIYPNSVVTAVQSDFEILYIVCNIYTPLVSDSRLNIKESVNNCAWIQSQSGKCSELAGNLGGHVFLPDSCTVLGVPAADLFHGGE